MYVLDDPLSAVDAHVGKALMTKCIQGTLQGRGKGVILVTHQLQYLSAADRVLVLNKQGGQTFYGTYSELMECEDVKGLLELNDHDDSDGDRDREREGDGYDDDGVDTISEREGEGEIVSGTIEEEVEGKMIVSESDTVKKQQSTIIQIEDKVTGKMSWSVYTRYLQAGGICYGITVILIMFLSQGLLMITDYWLRWWASSSFGNQNNIEYVYIFAILVVLCIIIGFGRAWIWFQFSLKAASTLHQRSLWSIVHSPMQFFIANPTGRILNRFAKDQNLVDETLPTTFFSFAESFVFSMSAIILVCISIPWLILVMPILGIHFIYLRQKYLASTREIKRIEATTRSPIYSDFSATLDGIITLRAYQLEQRASYLFQYQLDQNGQVYFSFLMAARWLGFRLDMETSIVLILVAFLAVILRDSIDPGLIGFTLVYTMQLSGLFQWAVRLSVEVETQMTSVERINAYAALPPEPGYVTTLQEMIAKGHEEQHQKNIQVYEKDTFEPVSSDDVELSMKNGTGVEVGRRNNGGGTVEFQGVTVRYRKDLNPVLQDITITMHAGQKIGVCGRTGCGKSSTLLALLRLNLITEGDIIIDGKSLLNMSLEEARGGDIITMIPQEPHLFSGSVRFNLDPFNLYSDIEIWDALKDAHIADYLSSSQNGGGGGLSMRVEEGGKNFSVGQRQLLSLARAILRRSKVVLMDEVTASIDFQTDRLIQETIRRSPTLKSATIITVAHRLRTIGDSDVIVVVDAGRVVEADTPKALLSQESSLYRKLAERSGEFDEILRLAESSASLANDENGINGHVQNWKSNN